MEFLSKNKNIILNTLLLLTYCALTIFCTMHHEIWRDEAQVWVVVRDLNLFGIIDHVRIEGHPLLWYFIVMLPAKLKLPVFSMQVLSLGFMACAAGLFLYRSPFNIVTKACVLFSAGFLYWLSVISRSYSLVALFLFVLAMLYPVQRKRPFLYAVVLGLLSQTHVLMSGFCAGMCALFLYDNIIKNKETPKKYIAPFLVCFLPLLLLTIYIFSNPHDNVSVQNYMLKTDTGLFKSFISVLVNTYMFMTNIKGLFVTLLIVASFSGIFVENKKIFCVYLFSMLYQLVVYTYIWSCAPEKAALFFAVTVFCWWVVLDCRPQNELSKTKKILYNILLAVIFGMSVNVGFMLLKNDIRYDYSSSQKTAEFIEKNIEKDAVLVTFDPVFTSGISAYLKNGQKFYYPDTGEYYTFSYDGRANTHVSAQEQTEFYKLHKNIYYIQNWLSPSQVPVFAAEETTLIPTEKFYMIKRKGF